MKPNSLRSAMLVAGALAGLPSACGALDQTPGTGFEGSCAHPTYCDEYYDSTPGLIATDRDRCPTVDSGVWSATQACARANLIGGCTYTVSGVPGHRIEWYEAAWGPKQLAIGTCTGFGGTFQDAGGTTK